MQELGVGFRREGRGQILVELLEVVADVPSVELLELGQTHVLELVHEHRGDVAADEDLGVSRQQVDERFVAFGMLAQVAEELVPPLSSQHRDVGALQEGGVGLLGVARILAQLPTVDGDAGPGIDAGEQPDRQRRQLAVRAVDELREALELQAPPARHFDLDLARLELRIADLVDEGQAGLDLLRIELDHVVQHDEHVEQDLTPRIVAGYRGGSHDAIFEGTGEGGGDPSHDVAPEVEG